MRNIVQILMFWAAVFSAVSANAQSPGPMMVRDNCSDVILTNPRSLASRSYHKNAMSVSKQGPYLQLLYGTGPSAVILAIYDSSNVHYVAGTIDSAKDLIYSYLSYVCIHITGSNGSGSFAFDTLPVLSAEYTPVSIESDGLDSVRTGTYQYRFIGHDITVSGTFMAKAHSSMKRLSGFFMQLPTANESLNSLDGIVASLDMTKGGVVRLDTLVFKDSAAVLIFNTDTPIWCTYSFYFHYTSRFEAKGKVIRTSGQIGAPVGQLVFGNGTGFSSDSNLSWDKDNQNFIVGAPYGTGTTFGVLNTDPESGPGIVGVTNGYFAVQDLSGKVYLNANPNTKKYYWGNANNDDIALIDDSTNTFEIRSNFISTPNLPSYRDDADAASHSLGSGILYQTDGTGSSPLNVRGILMRKQ